MNKYNWKGINHPSERKGLEKKTKKNNLTIALNVFYAKKEKVYPAYVSKHNSNRKEQANILMIPNRERDGITLH